MHRSGFTEERQHNAQRGSVRQPQKRTVDGLSIKLELNEGSDRELRRLRRQISTGRLLWSLVLVTAIVASITAAVPDRLLESVTIEPPVPVTGRNRIVLGVVAFVCFLISAGLHHRFSTRNKAAKLARGAYLLVSPRGLTIHHPGLNRNDIRLTWPMIRAVSIDGGMDPDGIDSERRFPLARTNPARFLYDQDDVNSVPIAMLSTRPQTPNLVIVFNRMVLIRNEHARTTKSVFGPRGQTFPVVAPDAQSEVIALMACVTDVRDARAAFLPSGRLRALRVGDLSRRGVTASA